jgi:alpha-L-fucosidase 2
MKIKFSCLAASLLLILLMISFTKQADQSRQFMLWFDHPAPEWEQALPAGNGRLGIMDFGDPVLQRVQFNEESLWAGAQFDHNNPEALEHLERIRELIFEHRNREAYDLAEETLLSTPPRIRSYQNFADLYITHQIDSRQVIDYWYELNLRRGVISTSFTCEKTRFSREALVSTTDDLIVLHLEADGPQKIHAEISLSREKDAKVSAPDGETLLLEG